ncbi:inositol monophosphatase 1-like [Ostrea edulis]|uniref:inositol monophosphatase 1-like n=1 Tax=Ostrea edulis TaxID=37623 RepID=UPI0020950DAA|nr:inositol monophosphatase 1-like [Ostrea edulis]XP_048748202.1 inositol monophosphatase 1-like [Ostrea edulis]
MSDHSLTEYLNTAQEVARKAGEMVKEAFYKEKDLMTKESYADIVTETDQAVEKLIISLLHEKYPTHQFIGEESTAEGKKVEWTDAPTWIIDPIDGTANFVHSIPQTCVCIGLSINKQMVVGVVHLPITGQTYFASKGGGAYCNSQRITVSKVKDLKKSVVITEAGNSRDPKILSTKMNNVHRVVEASHGVRMFGSAAVNMCTVAEGKGEVYFEYGIHIWDFAAAGIIFTEAGGVLIDPSGGDVDFLSRRVLAACNRDIADQLSPVLTHIEFDQD